MSTDKHNIEDIFSKGFSEYKVEPDEQVLRNLRFKLWKMDFFSLNMKKFNVAYTVVIVAGLATIPFLSQKNEREIIVHDETGNIEELRNEIVESKGPVHNEAKSEIGNKVAVPLVNFNTSATKGCVPLKVSFKNSSEYAKSYKWSFGDGTYSENKNPVHSYKTSGEYTAVLEITGVDDISYKKTQKITVLNNPIANFELKIEDSDIKERNVSFVNNSENASSYKWYFGDNTSSEKELESHTYKDYGVYDVTLIATSAAGCRDTFSLTNSFLMKDYSLYFPTSFRPVIAGPSNDGAYGRESMNISTFYPDNNGVDSYELSIYSSSGSRVFYSDDIKQGWNGYYKGRLVPRGTYSYKAEGVYPNGKPFIVNGSVKVIIDNYQDNY